MSAIKFSTLKAQLGLAGTTVKFSQMVSASGGTIVPGGNKKLTILKVDITNATTSSSLPVEFSSISGLVGYYPAENWTGTQWLDSSSIGNHCTVYKGTITKTTNGLNSKATLSGGLNDGIRFPSVILPSTYTLFHITKYTNTSYRKRIFDGYGTNDNWLSGFWNNTAGIAFHKGWLTTNFSNDLHGLNWVLSTDQNSLYRSNRVNRTNGSPGSPSNCMLSLNYGAFAVSETPSMWACACVIVYNRTLTATEITTVENKLFSMYGVG